MIREEQKNRSQASQVIYHSKYTRVVSDEGIRGKCYLIPSEKIDKQKVKVGGRRIPP